jgi:hypothetical protein
VRYVGEGGGMFVNIVFRKPKKIIISLRICDLGRGSNWYIPDKVPTYYVVSNLR